ncbi:SMP-30/gluconolactonase/LRE family protein [Roseomonas populi]|uniref:SMP-30/gluconolactonase/LRE family protein n=1 Tax=Roseomonas populi TaxID=3121582 RepID=A0ABT1X1K3_9PROT|nr:SMP-30/gluconolactonase/LRE family protein [Roseomonas pecuniae]MCR0981077.1 SMP-30/gluconolactonase/LRE family protein [Roseomonas pecuniae]
MNGAASSVSDAARAGAPSLPAFREVTRGLRFPEGPVALQDGSVLVVELASGNLLRVAPDGGKSVVAHLGGAPNGAAIGPDGRCYICNNGGAAWIEDERGLHPNGPAPDYAGGRIQRVDLGTGAAETLFTECDGIMLKAPNDLVFDAAGGFWFTDYGKARARDMDRTGVLYADAGGGLTEVLFPMEKPNGIGLSPDDRTLYVAETVTARLWAFDLDGPGRIARRDTPNGGRLLATLPGACGIDSLAVDSAGNICLATIFEPSITVVSPSGEILRRLPMPDRFTTNIAFGGPDLRTAYVTQSLTGRLLALEWPVPGLGLHWLNR